jgi:transposase InsO family protein
MIFKTSLQASRGSTLEQQRNWRSALYGEVMQLGGKSGLSIAEACDAARLSRAGFYRHFDEHVPRQADTELRAQIQQICLEKRCYGSRRVALELHNQGQVVNRKRVIRLMRADNLLCLRKRRFVCTTDSRHTYAVYPNLTRDWKPDGINQLWVADITYIRLRESFLYLAVILDANSRRVIGWALEDTLEAQLTVKALKRALEARPVKAPLVHHSDRGVQYCAREYVDLLRSHGIQISMSRAGNPYDNALAESFMRTLKCEEVYLHTYRDREDVLVHIQDFLERIYNCERLHSSLGYTNPVAYEAAALAKTAGGPA